MQTWGNNVIVLKICNLGVCILDLCKVNWLMYSILYKKKKIKGTNQYGKW